MPALQASAEEDGGTVTIWWLRRELGKTSYGESRLLTYINLLIQQAAFPRPLPDLQLGRGKAHSLTRAVTTGSRWRRDQVEAWFVDDTPPTTAAQVEAHQRRQAANEMDTAALGLRLVGGRGA